MQNDFKRLGLLVTALLSILSVSAFKVKGLIYKILSEEDRTVEVTYQSMWSYENSSYVSGNIIIPESVTYNGKVYSVCSIGELAFQFCDGIKSVEIPSSVTTIGYESFLECNNLSTINLPESLASIDDYAFFRCFSLTSLNIPESVTFIGSQAFLSCDNLKTIDVAVDNKNYTSIDGVLYSKDISTLIKYPSRKKGKSFSIPETVTTTISFAFNNCSDLQIIDIPKSVRVMGIVQDTDLFTYIFPDCSSLTTINVDPSNEYFTSIDGVLYSKDTSVLIKYPEGKQNCDWSIGNHVVWIGSGAFHGCKNLTSVVIPNSVNVIDIYAFSDSNLESIDLPNSVKYIQNYAFSQCANLKSIRIPESVTSIASGTFSDCSSLTDINMCGSITSIDDFAFAHCSNLSSINIPNSVSYIGNSAFAYCSKLQTVHLPESLTSISDWTFGMCESLEEITLPNSVKTIGKSAFYNCRSLVSIDIPSTVTRIGENGFLRCESLTSITIPESITEIGSGAFSECINITSVYYGAEEPLEGGYDIFSWVYDNATLYVPEMAVEKCRLINPWRNFKNIEAFDFTGVKDVADDVVFDLPCEIFTMGGVKVGDTADGLASGVYIIRQGSEVKKIAVK